MGTVESIKSAKRAAVILAHPVRARILSIAQSPMSASDLARTLGLPRQRVNYHVRQLADGGFLKPAAQQRKGNMVEQQFVASAGSYVFAPEVLGDVAPADPASMEPTSAASLLAVCARAQRDVANVMETAHAAGVRLRTLSMMRNVRFATAEQRTEFMNAVADAIESVIEEHGSSTGGQLRLVLGCYPVVD